jgi:hypothetical protein
MEAAISDMVMWSKPRSRINVQAASSMEASLSPQRPALAFPALTVFPNLSFPQK